jgi:hypothetical protein
MYQGGFFRLKMGKNGVYTEGSFDVRCRKNRHSTSKIRNILRGPFFELSIAIYLKFANPHFKKSLYFSTSGV